MECGKQINEDREMIKGRIHGRHTKIFKKRIHGELQKTRKRITGSNRQTERERERERRRRGT